MFESIRSYIRLSRLAKAVYEAQQSQHSSFDQATAACKNQIQRTGKEYAVVKHQVEEVYWVVRATSAKVLAKEGHLIM